MSAKTSNCLLGFECLVDDGTGCGFGDAEPGGEVADEIGVEVEVVVVHGLSIRDG